MRLIAIISLYSSSSHESSYSFLVRRAVAGSRIGKKKGRGGTNRMLPGGTKWLQTFSTFLLGCRGRFLLCYLLLAAVFVTHSVSSSMCSPGRFKPEVFPLSSLQIHLIITAWPLFLLSSPPFPHLFYYCKPLRHF